MKKFLINIAIFFAIVAAVDFSLGKVFHYLQSMAGGRTGAEYYVCEKATEDVIIMGSSRASHHYVPEFISGKLGMTCFNAGQDGNGIILQYGRWKMISERYTPKLLIYDISTIFDMAINDNMTYVDRLKPFCDDGEIRSYIASIFPMERIKTISKLYCYNYKFIEMFFDCIRKTDYMNTAGYLPLYGHIRKEIVEGKQPNKKVEIATDEVKLLYIEQLVKEAKEKGADVVLVLSPYWNGGGYSIDAYRSVRNIAEKYNARFEDLSNIDISRDPDYFKDSYHLNDKGAKAFTDFLLSCVRI